MSRESFEDSMNLPLWQEQEIQEAEDIVKDQWESFLLSTAQALIVPENETPKQTAQRLKHNEIAVWRVIAQQLSFYNVKMVMDRGQVIGKNEIALNDVVNIARRLTRKQMGYLFGLALGPVLSSIQTQGQSSLSDPGPGETLRPTESEMTSLVKKFVNTLVNIEEDKSMQQVIVSAYGSEFINVLNPEDPEYTYLDPSIDATDVGRIKAFVQKFWVNLNTRGYKRQVDFFNEVAKYPLFYLDFLAVNELMNSFGVRFSRVSYNSFPAMFAGIPIPHCQEIEIARSGKILKFRATGSIFLAQQKSAGEDAIRVECLLVGEESILVILLWVMFLLGRGKAKEVTKIMSKETSLSALKKMKDKLVSTGVVNLDMQKPTYEHHNTFPLITRHFIIPNTYIETLSFEDRVIDGRDTLKISILLRTYEKPFQFYNYLVDEDKNLMMVAQAGNPDSKMYRLIEVFGNVAWRVMMSEGYLIQEQSWRNGVDFQTAKESGRDDVYYDVSMQDLAISVGLGVIGAV